MSDTTTITPEEMVRAKENSDALTAAYMSGNYDGLKEAENVWLTKMVDWLANNLIDCPRFTNCAMDCAECRKEAARRAVAAGEE